MRHPPRLRRSNLQRLLASSSVAALLIGGGTPATYACTTVPSGGYANPSPDTIAGLCAPNNVTGSIDNEGTISPSGISVTASTFTGSITNGGTISGSSAGNRGIYITPPTGSPGATVTFEGGITNSGKISSYSQAIYIIDVASFGTSGFNGGITNTGTVSSSTQDAIDVVNVGNFAGGISITSGGTALAAKTAIYVGLSVSGASATATTFSGGITNSGTITVTGAASAGILVGGFVGTSGGTATFKAFSGGITNTGLISAPNNSNGIVVAGYASAFSQTAIFVLSTFSGGISNSGTISAAAEASMSAAPPPAFMGPRRYRRFPAASPTPA